MILGITGGLGCGKSTATRQFENRGFRRLDSDELVREKVLTDPAVQQMTALHTNQAALGGGSLFSAATAAVTVDTNTAAIVGASGTAVGNVIGAAAKSAVK